MIKNPTINQKVYYFVGLEICKGSINHVYKETGSVEVSNWHYRKTSEIFPTEESAEKQLPKEYAKAIKNLNKQIYQLSKKRENLASKLAKLPG